MTFKRWFLLFRFSKHYHTLQKYSFWIGRYDILSKLATVIYPLCFKKQTLELLLYLFFKAELPINGLQHISSLNLNLSRCEKTAAKSSCIPQLFRPSVIESLFIVILQLQIEMQDAVLDNFKILSIITLSFNCGFPYTLGLEKLRTSRCNYVLLELPNVFTVVGRFTLF